MRCNMRRIKRAESDPDPAIDRFLDLLAADLARQVIEFPPALAQRMARLTEGVAVDLEEPITGPVAL
jgi:antitoxin PrlF